MDESSTTTLGERVRRAQRGDEVAIREPRHGLPAAGSPGLSMPSREGATRSRTSSQMVFVKMVRALGRLKAPDQFESWLFRLARNTCIDHLRRQKLRRIFIPFAPEHENVPEPDGSVDTRGARRPPPCPLPAPAEGPRPPRARPGGPQPRRDRGFLQDYRSRRKSPTSPRPRATAPTLPQQ